MSETALDALKAAAKIAGSPAALARAIGVSRQRMHGWLYLNNRLGCSPDYAIRVEQATGVSRHRLCPDVFGEKS